jgi:hypothetical protein
MKVKATVLLERDSVKQQFTLEFYSESTTEAEHDLYRLLDLTSPSNTITIVNITEVKPEGNYFL